MKLRFALFALLLAILNAAPATALVVAAEPEAAVQTTFDSLLAAVKANDRDAFTANGTEAVKKGTTSQVMTQLNKLLRGRLEWGYQATYHCQLKQPGHQVYLWKLTFKDDGDDLVVRLAIKDGKVAGFFLQ